MRIVLCLQWEHINLVLPLSTDGSADCGQIVPADKEVVGNSKQRHDQKTQSLDASPGDILVKFDELLQAKEEIHRLRYDYNQSIFKLREDKRALCGFVGAQVARLNDIRRELSSDGIQSTEIIPEINDALEFAEKRLEVIQRKRSRPV